jgi:membrane protein
VRITINRVREAVDRFVWTRDAASASRLQSAFIRSLRLSVAVVRDLAQGQLSLQAMGLVYISLLALVPLMAVSFSVLKAFGMHQHIEPILLNLLAPLGDKGIELSRQAVQFVAKMRVGVLGAVGLGLLIYTSATLIQKIERALNGIWQVPRGRRLVRRVGDYLLVILVGPMLFFAAIGVTASLASSDWLRPLQGHVSSIVKMVPYLLVIGGYAFVYTFIPNTKVRVRSACVGAVVAGVLWQSAGWAFAAFIAGSGQYRTVYAGLAILILLIVWLYLCWLILLIGASIAFYHQHPNYVTREPRATETAISNRRRERLGLLIARLIGRQYVNAEKPLTADALAHALQSPLLVIEQLLSSFETHALLARTSDNPPAYLPTRAIEAVALREVLRAVRAAGAERGHEPRDRVVDALTERLTDAQEHALARYTWRDLVTGELGTEGAAKSGRIKTGPASKFE